MRYATDSIQFDIRIVLNFKPAIKYHCSYGGFYYYPVKLRFLKSNNTMEDIFFKDWKSIGHVVLATVIAFITLFFFLRISGKRTLAKLNAFDFVVTVALGSTLSYMMLAMVPLTEGAIVLFLIIIL
jgi:hypothetical protein